MGISNRSKKIIRYVFGEEEYEKLTPWKLISYVIVVATVVVLFFTLRATYHQNEISIKGNLDNRFSQAFILLGSEDPASRYAAIHALHNVALDAKKMGKDQEKYVEIIGNAFCGYYRTKCKKQASEIDESFSISNSDDKMVSDLVLNLLTQKDNIYQDYDKVFSDVLIHDIELTDITMKNFRFENSVISQLRIKGYWDKKTIVKNIILDKCFIINSTVEDVYMDELNMYESNFYSFSLKYSTINNTNKFLGGLVNGLHDCVFVDIDLNYVSMYNTVFDNSYFYNINHITRDPFNSLADTRKKENFVEISNDNKIYSVVDNVEFTNCVFGVYGFFDKLFYTNVEFVECYVDLDSIPQTKIQDIDDFQNTIPYEKKYEKEFIKNLF